jgi:oligopeptide transport system ATP-binding protein
MKEKIEVNLNPIDNVKQGETILSVKDLVVRFSVRNKILTAIRKVSLDIYKGEIIAIVGESGSGKSVFTKCFTGMLEENGSIDSESQIMYAGVDISKFTTNEEWLNIRGKRISTIFQDPMTSLNPLRRIGSQIAEVIRLHRGYSKEVAKAEAIKLLKRVGIKDAEQKYDDYPFQYSGGMRQRVVIAIALACNPVILICDEPTTALDVTIQAQILNLIKELKEEYGFTIIFITHDLGVVAEIADRVAVMYSGQIIEYGTAKEIFYDPQHPYTWALLSSLPQLGEKGEKLYSITGTPPSLFNEIKGDAFAPRNPYALAVDFVKEPPLFKVTDTHYAKTWLLDPRAPKVERPQIIAEISERVAKIYSGGDHNE